jgi:hypothetical protein
VPSISPQFGQPDSFEYSFGNNFAFVFSFFMHLALLEW